MYSIGSIVLLNNNTKAEVLSIKKKENQWMVETDIDEYEVKVISSDSVPIKPGMKLTCYDKDIIGG